MGMRISNAQEPFEWPGRAIHPTLLPNTRRITPQTAKSACQPGEGR
jgi:hypothetical protein